MLPFREPGSSGGVDRLGSRDSGQSRLGLDESPKPRTENCVDDSPEFAPIIRLLAGGFREQGHCNSIDSFRSRHGDPFDLEVPQSPGLCSSRRVGAHREFRLVVRLLVPLYCRGVLRSGRPWDRNCVPTHFDPSCHTQQRQMVSARSRSRHRFRSGMAPRCGPVSPRIVVGARRVLRIVCHPVCGFGSLEFLGARGGGGGRFQQD